MVRTKKTDGGRMFAEVVGSPGVRPRFVGFMRGVFPLLLFMFLAGFFLRAAFPYPAMTRSVAGLLLVGLCVGLALVLYAGEKRLASYFKGAQGEEQVARALHLLPPGFTVFHGLLLRGAVSDMDHVVVGPTGVFVVETKNWAGTMSVVGQDILYDGRRPDRSPLEQVKQAVGALQKSLSERCGRSIPVSPIICFAGGRLEGGVQGVAGVMLCGPDDLRHVLTEPGEFPLSEAEAAAVAGELRHMDRRNA
ncbi:MAG: nuclease-related domain-containing protein [Kiritimatiellae bacterium]|nr:nuclease-related domain-containing protein [Kiritimatiellia bacterium]